MSSGAFFPASLIHKAATSRMAALIAAWTADGEEDVQKRMKAGRRKWFFWRVPLTREEAERESQFWTLKKYIVEHPMENRWYAAASKLASTAKAAMKIEKDATIFVSTEDFHNVRDYYAKAEVKGITA